MSNKTFLGITETEQKKRFKAWETRQRFLRTNLKAILGTDFLVDAVLSVLAQAPDIDIERSG